MKRTHLSFEERIQIEQSLNDDQSISEIAGILGRPIGTVSKEIQRNRSMKEPKTYGRTTFHFCELGEYCIERFDPTQCHVRCKNFKEKVCPTVTKAPYVCNGCTQKSSCYFRKFYYKSGQANVEAERIKTESRSGISLTPRQLKELDDLLSPLIAKGQPLAHIYQVHQEDIPINLRTVYTYVDKGYFSFKNIDLRRKVSYKPRKKKTAKKSPPKAFRENRSYDDFTRELAAYPDLSVVEMDTVEGTKDSSKCLLTLFFRDTKLLLIRLLEQQTADEVGKQLNDIEMTLSLPVFAGLFEMILTDNGHEFSQPEGLEKRDGEFYRTRIFYCDPRHSEQKGAVEKSHEYIRYILPKGTNFDDLTQEKVDLIASHINSTLRPSMGVKTPFEVSAFLWLDGENILDQLHIKKIKPDDVILNEKLLQ